MKDVLIDKGESKALLNAIRALTVGGVAVLPTDTLYGIHGLATVSGMGQRLAALKGDPGVERGFILLVADAERLERWAVLEDLDRAFIAEHCPGPVSMILRAREDAPAEWTTEDETGQRRIAFRLPAGGYIRELLEVLDQPLYSTSANGTGQPPLESAREIVNFFGDKVDLVVADAELEARLAAEGAAPSALVDLTRRPPKLLREGKTPLAIPS